MQRFYQPSHLLLQGEASLKDPKPGQDALSKDWCRLGDAGVRCVCAALARHARQRGEEADLWQFRGEAGEGVKEARHFILQGLPPSDTYTKMSELGPRIVGS